MNVGNVYQNRESFSKKGLVSLGYVHFNRRFRHRSGDVSSALKSTVQKIGREVAASDGDWVLLACRW